MILKQLYKNSQDLFNFKSIEINQVFHSENSGCCHFTKDYLMLLQEYNDFAAPIQLSYLQLTKINKVGSNIEFISNGISKLAFIDIKFESPAFFQIRFVSEMDAQSFFEKLNKKTLPNLSIKNNNNYYPKISVVENYIKLNSVFSEEKIEIPATNESANFEETGDIFGSSIATNATKDTSFSNKKKRSVSEINEDSNLKSKDWIVFTQTQESNDIGTIKPNQKPIESQPQHSSNRNTPTAHQQQDSEDEDIWDFEKSGIEADTVTKKLKNSKALKLMDNKLSFKKSTTTTANTNKKLLKFETTGSDAGNTTKKNKTIEVDSSQEMTSDFMTSPAAVALVRASSRKKQAEESKKRPSALPSASGTKAESSPKINSFKKPKTTTKRITRSSKLLDKSNEDVNHETGNMDDIDKADLKGFKRLTLRNVFEDDSLSPKKKSTKNKEAKPIKKSDDSDSEAETDKEEEVKPLLMPTPSSIANPINPINATSNIETNLTSLLQNQIFNSIGEFSNQLISKIDLINSEINNSIMNDLMIKYNAFFNKFQHDFNNDMNKLNYLIADVKTMLHLSKAELLEYFQRRRSEICD